MNQGNQDVSESLTAAGTTQATALELINGINMIGTAASGSGVMLSPNATPGSPQYVYNGGANPVKVYPPSGAQINSLGANTFMTLGTNTACEFWFASSTQIIGILSA